ncbi:MAG: uracil-DNA glycosylase [Gammaproteobacteria bacterium]|nr:uracil-DNA glycosylase [Gammaproteobacteria bacterium]
MNKAATFNPDCQLCPRLADFLREVKDDHPGYFCKPVPAFGDSDPGLLIVGLAPGKHGANQSGRPFTGDHAGILLYETLYKEGFSNNPVSSHAKDDLKLINCRITNAVKCLPPDNKPTTSEIRQCNPYLSEEIRALASGAVILALGKIAHDAILRASGLKLSSYKFAHGARHELPDGRLLVDSYHCSRYNTQTRRLTEAMFHQVFQQIRLMIE